jgi:RimJ/RimL family protein N-acetyltransferase
MRARIEPRGAAASPLLEKLLGDPARWSISADPSRPKHRSLYAFPSVGNAPSNGICRKLGFTLVGETEYEYPPGSGRVMRCNDWRLDLRSG